MEKSRTMRAILVCLIGWAVPGGGHIMQHKWGRGLLLLGAILTMFILGLYMDGRLVGFRPDPTSPDAFGTLFSYLQAFAEASVGVAYFIAKQTGLGIGDPKAFAYDYGNKYLYTAGLLNLLVILDAYDIALGKKG